MLHCAIPRRFSAKMSILAALLVGACEGGNAAYKTDPDGAIPRIVGDAWTQADLRIADPASATVLIYSHGTRRPQQISDCEAAGLQPPSTIEGLDGGSVHVVRHCSRAVEKGGPVHAGTQVFARAGELTRLAKGYAAAGVAPERIFLTGHSNGGWSSLMAYAQQPAAFGGVVAFAPAFAGRRSEESRFPWWRQDVRPRHVAKLEAAPELKALVFAYDGDAFNRPVDLAFLPKAHPGDVELVAYGCPGVTAHNTHGRDCRADQTVRLIRAFIGTATVTSQAGNRPVVDAATIAPRPSLIDQ